MILNNKFWIRAVSPAGTPLTELTFRFQIYEESSPGQFTVDVGNTKAFTHIGDGFYSIQLNQSVLGRIQQYIDEQWVPETEGQSVVVPSLDIIKHLAGTGANHSIEDITGLQDALDDKLQAGNIQALSGLIDDFNEHTNVLNQEAHEIANIDGLQAILDSMLIDVSGLAISIGVQQQLDKFIVVKLNSAWDQLFGFWQIAYVFQTYSSGTYDSDSLEQLFGQRTVASQSNLVMIPKPIQGNQIYDNGVCYMFIRARFKGIGGSTSPWSQVLMTEINEPSFTLHNFVAQINDNQALLQNLADMVASRVFVEVLSKQTV